MNCSVYPACALSAISLQPRSRPVRLGGQRYGVLGIAVVLLAGLLTVLPVPAVNGETAVKSAARERWQYVEFRGRR